MKQFTLFEKQILKLPYKQKLILQVLNDEFGGKAFGPELIELSENEQFNLLTINEVTWHMLRLRENNLVMSSKKKYKGRILNEYSLSPYMINDAVNIK